MYGFKPGIGGRALADVPTCSVEVKASLLDQTSGDLNADGYALANSCKDQFNQSDVRPKLLLFWATKAFAPFLDALEGIASALPDTPLVGCSVEACIHEGRVYEQGALLVAIGSQLMEVELISSEISLNAPVSLKRDLQRLADQRSLDNSFTSLFFPNQVDAEGRASRVESTIRKCVQVISNRSDHTQVFGGLASSTPESEFGVVFSGQRVLEAHAVAAVATCEFSFASGAEHGLSLVGPQCIISEIGPDGSTSIDGPDAEKLISATSPTPVLRSEHLRDRIYIKPTISDGSIMLPRRVQEGSQWSVLQPDSERLIRSSKDLRQRLLQRGRLDKHRLVAMLSLVGKERLTDGNSIGYDCRQRLKRQHASYPAYFGAYLDGEIGLNQSGEPRLYYWGISELVLTDALPKNATISHALKALEASFRDAVVAPTIDEAVELSLDCVTSAGYKAAMVSLKLNDGHDDWIVAHSARGSNWKKKVLPATRRPYSKVSRKDVLVQITEDAHPKFIRDARTHPDSDNDVAIDAGVISFFAIPLLNKHKQVLGVLQVDLGDMSDFRDDELPVDMARQLNALGSLVAAAISRAIKEEELSISRRLSDISKSLESETDLTATISQFSEGAAQLIGCNVHYRSYDRSSGLLVLSGGVGEYYEAAIEERLAVSSKSRDVQSSAMALVQRQIVNNAHSLQSFRRKQEKYSGTKLGNAMSRIGAFADLPVTDNSQVLGTISFGSTKQWFFNQSKINSLDDIAKALSSLISRVREKQATLLLGATTASPRPNVHTSQLLDEHVAEICDVCNAKKASLYVRDEMTHNLVLRAALNWNSDAVNTAFYGLHEGIAGILRREKTPISVSSLNSFSTEQECNVGKYFGEMFGRPLGDTFDAELLAFPLYYEECLEGVLLLHRGIDLKSPQYRQASLNTFSFDVLSEAQQNLATTLYALKQRDMQEWRSADLACREKVIADVFSSVRDDDNLFKAFTSAVVKHFRFGRCSIVRRGSDGRLRVLSYDECRSSKLCAEDTPKFNEWHLTRALDFDEIIERSRAERIGQNKGSEVLSDIVEEVYVPLTHRGEHSPWGVVVFAWSGLRKHRHIPSIEGEDSNPLPLLPHYDRDGLVEIAERLNVATEIRSLSKSVRVAKSRFRSLGYGIYEHVHQLAKILTAVLPQVRAVKERVTGKPKRPKLG